jgi:hypothetical protein
MTTETSDKVKDDLAHAVKDFKIETVERMAQVLRDIVCDEVQCPLCAPARDIIAIYDAEMIAGDSK